ncbi:MAG: Bax inhibitor-1 family protein, partial [Gammaproteobacteria bacterium]
MSTLLSNTARQSQSVTVTANSVIRNTYTLLSMTLLFSALTAGISMMLKLPHPGLLLTLGGYFGLLFATSRFRNSGLGLVFVFALTGFMGYTLGPILNSYLMMANGS